MKHLFSTISLILLLTSSIAFAQNFPPGPYEKFIEAEASNDYKPDTTVAEAYRPAVGRTFRIKYLEIPVEDIHLVDSGQGSQAIRHQILFQKNGKSYFRFFIHPESEHLYKPLMQKYGVAGEYMASPTASTRSLLAWPLDKKMGPPLFLKLSLAQTQDNLGRIIPGWEVRRSVGISSLIALTPDEVWKKNGASVISEFMGAYIDKKENIGFHVDDEQGTVYEHGLIARDASFLTDDANVDVVPLFSLFTQHQGQAPLIIQLWKKTNLSFPDFIAEYLYKPFLEQNKYLMFEQGIIPEIHGQNVLVALDRNTKTIKHFYHRDVGSMKVDLRLRWIKGLSIEPLRTSTAAFDFKFARAPETIEGVFKNYLNDWIFRWGYLNTIKKYVPNFTPEQTYSRLQVLLNQQIEQSFPLKQPRHFDSILKHLEAYYQENPPQDQSLLRGEFDGEKLGEFVTTQFNNKQFMMLPSSWKESWQLKNNDMRITRYGIIFAHENSLYLIFHASKDLSEISMAPAAPVVEKQEKVVPRKTERRIGIYTGTFDPPHSGHRLLILQAMKDLNLDGMIILPNLSPAHKPNATSFEIRKKMAQLTFGDIPGVSVGDPRYMKIIESQGVSGLQEELSREYSTGKVFHIMGDDSLEKLLATRDRPFPKNLSLVFATRDDEEKKNFPATFGDTPVIEIPDNGMKLSSTKLRKQIADGAVPTDVAAGALRVIQQYKLYGAHFPLCGQVFLGAGH